MHMYGSNFRKGHLCILLTSACRKTSLHGTPHRCLSRRLGTRRGVRRRDNRIAQRADAIDREIAHIADLHLTDSLRRPGHDEVTWQQSHYGREIA